MNKDTSKREPVSNKSTDNEKIPEDELIVVGIGASAGGLAALETFFKNMPPDTGLAFVIVQHLDPGHESMLPNILARITNMEVVQISDNILIEANTIYVIPPGNNILMNNDHLILQSQEQPRGVPLPVDIFFKSLKENKQDKSVGIILSGSGSDGTLGIKEIKAVNGLVIVQQPETAGHTGMPESAINTGMVDFILAPDKMPEKLIEFVKTSSRKPDSSKLSDGKDFDREITRIFNILNEETNHDFTDYKPSTIFRRIERRMAVNAAESIKEYINILESNPAEVESLFKELLIGVTGFFRDKKAFEALENTVISKIINKKEGSTVRIWVPGCSSGEEAYTLAIMVNRFMRKKHVIRNIRIFASDIDEKALDKARKGVYPLNIEADVPKTILKSYFNKNKENYQIKKEIRDLIIFANHSIIKDPPYSRNDLISCRNLMIYFQSNIQDKALQVFHYALKKGGFLFLGNSESVGRRKKMFEIVDLKYRIYKKRESVDEKNVYLDYNYFRIPELGQKKFASDRIGISLKEFTEKTVLSKFADPVVVIDKEGEILYSVGNLQKFFGFVTGEPSNNILNAANEELKVPLANGLMKVIIERKPWRRENIRLKVNNEFEFVRILIEPIQKPASLNNLFLVFIESMKIQNQRIHAKDETIAGNDKDEYIHDVETELKDTRSYLQNVIEELETSNEELKSSNEEVQSSNEELQSSNLELETSKEELQSLNEELETSNNELQKKVQELTEVNNDLNNFLTSTQIGTIFLDKNMKIRRFTPVVTTFMDLRESDKGRPISSFINNLDYNNFLQDTVEVLNSLIPKEAEVSFKRDRYFWMRILPYRTIEDSIEGVVITFTDITEQKHMQARAEKSQRKYKALFSNLTSGVLVQELIYENGLAVDARMLEANDAYFSHTGYKKKNIIGKRLKNVFPKYRKEVFDQLVKVVNTGIPYLAEEYSRQIGKHLRLSIYKFDENKGVTIFDDITAQMQARQELIRNERKFRNLFINLLSGTCINTIKRDGKRKKIRAEFFNVNPVFESISGKKAEELIGNEISGVYPLCDKPIIDRMLSAIEKGENYTDEIHCEKSNKYFRLIAFPLEKELFVMSVQDITVDKKENLASRHLASIVEYSEDAIYSVSLDAKITSWNKASERFYGYTSDEIIGKDVSILSYYFDHDKHMEFIRKVEKGKKFVNLELYQKSKKGEVIPVYLTKSPIFNDKANIIGISDIVKDLTRVKEREIELIKAKDKSEKAVQLKTAFLQNVSHEIRTPMNSILGFADILKHRLKNSENIKYLYTIEQSGNQLINLIDDILDVSRMDSGELTIEKHVFNLNELLQQIYQQFEGVKNKNHKEHIDLKLHLPESSDNIFLNTDRHRLQQIIDNLVSNAIKYTDEGSIDFGYSKDKGKLLFYVKDTGIGIEKEHQQIIFERFSRLETDTEKIFSGTGLGLSISKGLVNKMGGEIWCESWIGDGSTFFFTIPYKSDDLPREKPLQEHHLEISVPDLAGKTILVAEDDEYSFMMMNVMLQDTNANVLHAHDGQEAIEMLENHHIDLALLDIRLPRKNGYEIAAAIRKRGLDITIIAQTAYAMREERKKSLEAGFDEHLAKPISTEVLYNALNRFTKK